MASLDRTFWDTEFGKELAKLVPEETTRVIIDISMDDIVVAYYKTYASKEILSLDWSAALSKAKVVCGGCERINDG